MQEALKGIFQNKIKHIKEKSDLLKNALVNVKKGKKLYEKRLNKIAEMQQKSFTE